MTEISASTVAALRSQTGAGMMECKKALAEAGGDTQKAADILRKKGLQAADQRAGRMTREGRVFSYIHHNQKVGVLLELGTETDFAARSDEVEQLLKDLAMHIAAASPTPLAVDRDGVPAEVLAREKAILLEQDDMKGKPEPIREKIVAGRLEKFVTERVLLEQEYVKDPEKKVRDLVAAVVAKTGENVRITRFARFEVGA
ncbi:MAG: elongation factor Ts [Planctomycetota bacterium]|nr:MAG: elongation factor Ts [Planctomycetota bacterium]